MILAFLAGSFFVSEGQGIPVRSLKEKDLVFSAGEHMKFIMHYNWGIVNADLGTAQVDLDTLRIKGEKVFQCRAYGRTSKVWDPVFKVREYFTSCFTCDGLKPIRFVRNTYEGKYVAKNTYDYVWNAADPYIKADVYSSSRGQRNVSLPLDAFTYDLPSLFFLARNMDFDSVTPGVKHPMTFAVDDEVFHVHFIMYGREVKKVKGLGEINTIKFSARLVAGEIFKGDSDVFIWVTDDENRVPVWFEAEVLSGTVSGRLSEYSGLKHPFTSIKTRG